MSDEDLDELEAEMIRRREQEDAEEQDRLAAQRARANLTPLDPPGEWTVESRWKPLDTYTPEPIYGRRPGREEASREGMSLACCKGALAVRVISPEGRVVESWDRDGNFWLRHDEVGQP